MSPILPDFTVAAEWLLRAGFVLALVMAAVVIIERGVVAHMARHARHIHLRYGPMAHRALDGDQQAAAALAACPPRHRFDVATLLIVPLIDDRDPERIARTRDIVREMSVVPIADRYLRSRWWWRRALALRALGLLQMTDRTAQIIIALDDAHADVRAAALDAVSDLRNRASLQAIVVRLNDPSLPPGRCAAALAAFGPACEPFVLELARIDPGHRLHYIRALGLCGTARSRPALAECTRDLRPEVQAAALEVLAEIGLDDHSTTRAIACLQHSDPPVRAMAAFALGGALSRPDVATQLARHLDDEWEVAVRAAQSLRTLRPHGLDVLRECSHRQGLSGVLARQMLWEEELVS